MKLSICGRCERVFVVGRDQIAESEKFCGQCQARNVLDGFGLPTPPELLDPHSRQPALTEGEFQKLLKNMPDEGY